MTKAATSRKRTRGMVDVLPSGSIRVQVYAGIDAVSKQRLYLTEVVPTGPGAAAAAERARTRFLRQVDEQRSPRTRATVNELLDAHLAMLDESRLDSYETFNRNHTRPLIGELQLARIDGKVLDSFYKELRRCRAHCRGRAFVEHRVSGDHECTERCCPHVCRPLAAASLRKIHAILTGAGKRAVRWGWVGRNPFEQAEPIAAARPDPQPPTAEQAAAIVTEAWADPDWGMLVWLAMTTGARRGELCALRWDRVDFGTGMLGIRTNVRQRGARMWEKDTKTHQQRRITLDTQTLALLAAHRRFCAERAGLDDMSGAARIFSPLPDGSTWIRPDTVSQRYQRMCARLGWDMHIHQLRHYSATELIASGVDVRTVAGRLGHGGGGTTTLKFYSAFLAEADQRAAGSLATRMPVLPARLGPGGRGLASPMQRATRDAGDDSPYQGIAADLRGAITSGVPSPGRPIA